MREPPIPISEALTGHFRLRELPGPGPSKYYAVEDFTYSAGTGELYDAHGTGSYRQDTKVNFTQDMSLDLQTRYLDMLIRAHFTNTTLYVLDPFSDVQIQLKQIDGFIGSHKLSLDLHATTIKDIPLRIIHAGTTNVVLAWPASYGPGRVLHATRLMPLPDWQEMPTDIKQVGDEFQATLPATEAVGFLWLHTTDN